MVKEDTSNVIFRYQPDQYRVALYFPFIGFIQLVLLHQIAPERYDILHHPYYYGFYLVLVTIFGLANYVYRRSYRIAMGEQGLIVSSYLGAKKIFYMRLRRVELMSRNRGGRRCGLEIINDQGSPVIKISGDRLEMERVARDLNTRVKPFG
jgi:hypothetical protein